jgi:hypothetical protein
MVAVKVGWPFAGGTAAMPSEDVSSQIPLKRKDANRVRRACATGCCGGPFSLKKAEALQWIVLAGPALAQKDNPRKSRGNQSSISLLPSFHLLCKTSKSFFRLHRCQNFLNQAQRPHIPKWIANPTIPISPEHICQRHGW